MRSARCFAAAALAAALVPAAAQSPSRDPAAPITEERLRSTIRFLSHDLLEGRGVASRGDALARLYIATELEAEGLEAGTETGFEQPVPFLGITARVTKPLVVEHGGERLTFTAPADYTAAAGKSAPITAWDGAEIVFVGYGIHAPEQQWDDFKDVDVRGKVLLVMNDDPSTDESSFAGKTRLYYGRWSYKYEEAARRGAAGAIVIHTDASAGYPFQVIQATHGREAFWLPDAARDAALEIRSWCSEDAARRIAKLAGHDLDELRARAQTREFRPVALGARATLATENTLREQMSGNVVGLLRGTDERLRDEVVVVSAHFDHLGIGPEKKGDSIYNGALDNSTGVAGLICLARAAAAAPPPKRTLLFLAVTGEESGLLGSLHFANHPTVPKERIVANLNIDGLNIWGRTRDIAMIGHGKNSLTDVARELAEQRGRTLVADPETELGLFYRSDHFSFARIGVPSAYFKAGVDFVENAEGRRRLKASFTTVSYHQPSDEYDDRWRLDGAVDDLQLMHTFLMHVANAPDRPRWTPGDEFEKAR